MSRSHYTHHGQPSSHIQKLSVTGYSSRVHSRQNSIVLNNDINDNDVQFNIFNIISYQNKTNTNDSVINVRAAILGTPQPVSITQSTRHQPNKMLPSGTILNDNIYVDMGIRRIKLPIRSIQSKPQQIINQPDIDTVVPYPTVSPPTTDITSRSPIGLDTNVSSNNIANRQQRTLLRHSLLKLPKRSTYKRNTMPPPFNHNMPVIETDKTNEAIVQPAGRTPLSNITNSTSNVSTSKHITHLHKSQFRHTTQPVKQVINDKKQNPYKQQRSNCVTIVSESTTDNTTIQPVTECTTIKLIATDSIESIQQPTKSHTNKSNRTTAPTESTVAIHKSEHKRVTLPSVDELTTDHTISHTQLRTPVKHSRRRRNRTTRRTNITNNEPQVEIIRVIPIERPVSPPVSPTIRYVPFPRSSVIYDICEHTDKLNHDDANNTIDQHQSETTPLIDTTLINSTVPPHQLTSEMIESMVNAARKTANTLSIGSTPRTDRTRRATNRLTFLEM